MQPFLVASRNTPPPPPPPHKRLLKTEPHSFPFVFAVNRNNQSRLGKLTMTLIFGRKKRLGIYR